MVIEGKSPIIKIREEQPSTTVNCRCVMLPLGQIDKNEDVIDKDAKIKSHLDDGFKLNPVSFKFKVDVKQVKEIKDRILDNIRGWEIRANSIASNKIQLRTAHLLIKLLLMNLVIRLMNQKKENQ